MGCDSGSASSGIPKSFQSTHPVWDATVELERAGHVRDISIHASRMGCDRSSRRCARPSGYFNPRIPYGMRRGLRTQRHDAAGISIHASRMGCDKVPKASNLAQLFQSTHPVWDATRVLSSIIMPWHFNPRIPYGMRPPVRYRWTVVIVFQSTHPVWDATLHRPYRGRRQPISIHASRMGCDSPVALSNTGSDSISIHASRMGCDHCIRAGRN